MTTRAPYPLDYATHIPILVGLGLSGLKFKSILEYGAGLYSTPLFLNREAFPFVQEVISCENNDEWMSRVMCETPAGTDNRHVWYQDIDEVADSTYDLVFIDADTEPHKIHLIEETARTYRGIVVVHDSEVPSYAKAMDAFTCQHCFCNWEPNTAVAFHWAPAVSLNGLIEVFNHHPDLAVDDVPGWIAAFKEFYESPRG